MCVDKKGEVRDSDVPANLAFLKKNQQSKNTAHAVIVLFCYTTFSSFSIMIIVGRYVTSQQLII